MLWPKRSYQDQVLTEQMARPSYEVERFSFVDWPKSKCASPLESDEMCKCYFKSIWQEWCTGSFIPNTSVALPNVGVALQMTEWEDKKNSLDKTTWSQPSSKPRWNTHFATSTPSLLHGSPLSFRFGKKKTFPVPARSLGWCRKWPGKRPVCHSPPQCDPQPVGRLRKTQGDSRWQHGEELPRFPYYTIPWTY